MGRNPRLLDCKMAGPTEALAKLLRDDDPETVRLVKEQLVSIAEDNPSALLELADTDDALVSSHARDVLNEVGGRCADYDFSMVCHSGGEVFDIEQAAWSLARAIEPDFCTVDCEEEVNAWGRELLSRLPRAASNADRVGLLSKFLFGELGFCGNGERYYAEENSLMTRVVENRRGIPISLTLLAMMVGSRAAMKIEGINLPGHFIARHGEVFFDPFHGGRILDRAGIRSILNRQGLELKPSHLLPATPRQFLMRMLANLLYVYDLDGDTAKHERVKSWMDAIACGFTAR
jgi:regulator of sirC expression with transglutaminase-like and TPR domain